MEKCNSGSLSRTLWLPGDVRHGSQFLWKSTTPSSSGGQGIREFRHYSDRAGVTNESTRRRTTDIFNESDGRNTVCRCGILITQWRVTGKSPLPADHGLQEASAQYLIHYTSVSGVDGKTRREDTGAVFLPKGPAPRGGWPVVVWAHGTVGVATQCAPSLNPRSSRDQQYLNTWLSLGFAVVAPDYAGLGSRGLHHYLNARAEAWSVLDSITAALKSFPLSNKIIIVGQSQGAHAAFAASGYQPSYAPALHVLGTVLTGTPISMPRPL